MGFKFNNRVCVIEIENCRYSVVFQKSLIDRLNNAKDFFSRMKNCDDMGNDRACEMFDRAIDSILGKGSAKKIFSGRFPDITERFAVLKYIYDELTAFMERIAGEADVQPEK